MNAIPSPAQYELYAGLLPIEAALEPPPVWPSTIENDQLANKPPGRRKRAPRILVRLLIAFCVGVAATLAWQSYGDAAREIMANSYRHLRWLAPQAEPVAQNTREATALVPPSFDQPQLSAVSLDLEAVRQNVDRIAVSIA